MAYAVKRYTVEDDEILVGTAAAHIQARRTLAARLNPRHELEALQQVDFAADGRQPAYLVHGNFHFGHLHLVFDAVEGFSSDDGLIYGNPCTQFKIQFQVVAQLDLVGLRGVSDVGHGKLVGAGGQGNGVKSIRIRARSRLNRFAPKCCPEKHLTAGGIFDVTAELVGLGLGLNRHQGKK